MVTFKFFQLAYGAYAKDPLLPYGSTVNGDTLAVEKITDILNFPTIMAFLGPHDILVTEKKFSISNWGF